MFNMHCDDDVPGRVIVVTTALASWRIPVRGPWHAADYHASWGVTTYTILDDLSLVGFLFTSMINPGDKEGRARGFRVMFVRDRFVFEDVWIKSPWRFPTYHKEPIKSLAVALSRRLYHTSPLSAADLPVFEVSYNDFSHWSARLDDPEDWDGLSPGAEECCVR